MGNHHTYGPTPEMASLILASKLLWHGYSIQLIHSPHPQIIEKIASHMLKGIAFSTVTTWKLTAPFKWNGTYESKNKICRVHLPEMDLYGYGTSLDLALVHLLTQIYRETANVNIAQLFNSYHSDQPLSLHPQIIIYNWAYMFERTFTIRLTYQRGIWNASI